MALTIGNIYAMMYDKHGLTLYINDIFARYFNDRTEIPIQYMDYEITDIGSDEDGLVIHACVPYVEYKDLDIYGQINALEQYLNVVNPYERMDDITNMAELVSSVISFWECSEYTLDIHGNWYDETGTMVRR